MCGIAGWFCYSENRITKAELKNMLVNLEVRGVDATGVAWSTDKSTFILRSPNKASEFVKLKDLKEEMTDIVNSKWGFLHTRAATHGSPSNNLNNHPIMNSKGIIVHNGVVNFRGPKIAAKGETDSEQLMLNIQANNWIKALSDYYGSASFAYKDFRFKGFYIYTDGCMPLVWAKDEKRHILFFCSTDYILKKSIGNIETKPVEVGSVHYISDKGTRKVATVKKEYVYANNTNSFPRNYKDNSVAEFLGQYEFEESNC